MFGGDRGGERGSVGAVHVPELAKFLPDIDGESGGNGGAQRRCLVHGRSFDWDLDDVCLGLRRGELASAFGFAIRLFVGFEILTCMQMSELLIPPSTANSVSLWPLSISMASRMALVWKQAASIVARAM